MKHGFLLMAHKQPDLIERIVKKIEAPNHYIYIHYDLKGPDYEKIKEIRNGHKNVILLERKNVRWGQFSQTTCMIEGLRTMLSYGDDYDYYHLISGQDYPCISVEQFDAFFEDNDGTSFVRLDSEEETIVFRKRKFPYRLENWYLNDILDISIGGIKLYKIANRLLKIVPRPYKNINLIWGELVFNHT